MQNLLRPRHLLPAIALAVCAALPGVAQAQIPTSITFFGDSFLDTGNGDILTQLLLGTDLTPSPPYAPGRITNGLNWADYLAARFGRAGDAAPSLLGGRNFAIGTATTGLTGAMGLPIGMLAQYGGQVGQPLDPTGLYVLFGGANDLLGAASATPAARALAIQTAVTNIGTIAQGLYLQGARNFLIPNLPDIGKAPVSLGTPGAGILSAATLQFNQLLAQGLPVLGGLLPGSNFMGLSLDILFNNILFDAAQGGPRYGLTNTAVPCLVVAVPCSSAVFADGLHPTSAAHKLIADAAYARVVFGQNVSVVPEPATVLLVGCGLLACAAAVRRKRA